MGQKHGKAKRPSETSAPGGGTKLFHGKRPSETTSGIPASDASALTRKASSQQVEELRPYAARSNGSDAKRKASSASDAGGQYRRGSSQDPSLVRQYSQNGMRPPPEAISEDVPQQRKTLFDHMVAFYFRNDHERLMNGEVDVEGICDWALSTPDGITALNTKLHDKYGEDLDSFLINADLDKRAAEAEDEEEGDDEDRSNSYDETSSAGTVETQSTTLTHDAAMERPAMPTRRRPTNTLRFTLDSNGELVAPESMQLDHASPPDLSTQLKEFINVVDPSRMDEIETFVKFANDHGLVALNSELLVTFGRDLKGNTMNSEESSNHHLVDLKKFGVGFDSPLLTEMQNVKLNHSDSGKIDLNANTETGACNKFRLDTESPVFGMCKCGHERVAHMKRESVIKSSTLERKLAQRRESINAESTPPPSRSPPPPSTSPPPPSRSPPPPSKSPPPPNVSEGFKPLRPTTPRVKEIEIPMTNTPARAQSIVKPPPPAFPKASSNTTGQKPPRPKSAKKTRPKSGKNDDTIERLTASEKKAEPCSMESFQLDMSATEFGMCAKCGWKKQDHKAETSGGESGEVSRERRRPMSLKKNGPLEPCGHYKLDLTADAFGACVCGFPRSAHAGQGGSNTKAVSTTLEKRWQHMKEVAA